jgi:AcrR family transcriptional regulator
MANELNPRRSKKKGQIVETAETLFMRHGIKRITVEEICSKTGVSKMTFYKYFANKTALVKHLWSKWIEEGFEKLDEINATDIPFPEKIQVMFEWKSEFFSKISTEFIEDFLPIEFEQERIIQRFLRFIVEAQRRGDIRPEIRPEFLMAVLEKLSELANDDDLRKKYPSFIEFNREVKDFFYFGILARPESKTE